MTIFRTLCAGLLGATSAFNTAAADEITLTDHNGVEVTMPDSPKRIATLATLADNMVISLDGGIDRLVGTPPNSKSYLENGLIGQFFPAIANVSGQVVGNDGQPNIEELLNLNPDVVLQWGRKQSSIEAIEAAGLTAVGLKYKPRGMPKAWLTTLGTLMEQPARAEKFLNWHDEVYADITARTAKIAPEDRPRVLYMTHENRVGALKSHLQFYIETAGGRNVADMPQKFVEIDPEMLLKWDPDVIWVFGFNPRFTPKTLYENPIYADIKAVRNKRIYKVPSGGSRWDGPNQEFGLSMEWFTRTLHPDLMPGSFRDKISAAYPMLYGHEVSDAQIDTILRRDTNIDAAGYDRILE